MPRTYKSHIREKNILLGEKKIKNEFTQMFDPKYLLTSQFCRGII